MNNFLSLVWYRVLPAQYGGQKGIADFNFHLGKRVSLTCLCSRNNVSSEALPYKIINQLPVSRLQFWNPLVRRKILALIREQKFTHIILEHPWHGWLGKYKKQYGFEVIVHAHNIEHLRLKARNKAAWHLLKKTEERALFLADHILFKSAKDREDAITIFGISPEKCLVVPYGMTATKQPGKDPATKQLLRRKHNIAADKKLILFAGTLDYEPNAGAIADITDHIIPILNKKNFLFKVIICGALSAKKMASLNKVPGVITVGFVPSVQDYMQAADLFLNPVLNGSGIQTKNIEAIASGCPVVATTFAASGLPAYLINQKLFVSADNDWEAFADNIITASSSSTDTPRQFYDEYNWENIIDRLLPRLVSGE